MMKTAIIIQREQLGQYWTKSVNTDFFLVLAEFNPANTGVPDSLQILHSINDKIRDALLLSSDESKWTGSERKETNETVSSQE